MSKFLDRVKSALKYATPGRRVQYHPSYCEEAKNDKTRERWDIDSSHDTSVIRPDGSVMRGYARHRHSNDAELDSMAYELAKKYVELKESTDDLLKTLEWIRDNPWAHRDNQAAAVINALSKWNEKQG
jgi:hypothetical protein